MIIRTIKRDDIDAVIKLLDSCRPYVLPHHEYLYWILAGYHEKTSFVAVETDNIIGFVSGIQSVEQSSVFIWQICVNPAYRRKGIADKLLEKVFNSLEALGLRDIHFSIAEDNEISFSLFKQFASIHNLKMELFDTVDINNSNENFYKICK